MRLHRHGLLLAGALATAGLGAGLNAAASDASASHATPTVVIGSFHGRRPTIVDFSGDGGNIVEKLHWSWGQNSAVGHGRSGIDNCEPNCATGKIHVVNATITFSRPRHGRFTKIVELRTGERIVGRYHTDTWPLGASR